MKWISIAILALLLLLTVAVIFGVEVHTTTDVLIGGKRVLQ